MKRVLKLLKTRKCWRCHHKFKKSKMLRLFGGYICRDCYISVKPHLKLAFFTDGQ